ncbi:hypothetical protein RAE21_18030 [Rhodoferax sp. TBRC 17198]|mgnify:CR=1|jgi:hypothetical protein|uniref:hypothetical protein n=1 Tax=Rhodoferax sp. TaxID=50421 RepID=UPI0025F8D417|nr:hypothetical protein [Rhodoferax sp.]MDT7524286.1 hypothetical protein [Rhodoferax sp. TBRC 17198]
MAKSPTKDTIVNDGLNYKSKAGGSPFLESSYLGAATMSCFLCGKHRSRQFLKTRKLIGKSHTVCAPSCKELAEQEAKQ